jgi:two-component system, OmpR family, response regulator
MSRSLQHILVIDDDEDILDVLAAVLEDFGGYRVETCSSGADALVRAPLFQPDLILLDMAMPEMDGLTTLQNLRALPSTAHIPVVFLTAKATDLSMSPHLPGVLGFIAKPFHHRGLVEQIGSFWGSPIRLEQREPDTGRIHALRQYYLLALPQRLELLRTLWATQTYGALTTIQQHVHQLAGSGASLGFAALSAAATALEIEINQVLVTSSTLSTILPAASERLLPLLQHVYQAMQQSHTTAPEWPSGTERGHHASAE